MYFSREQIPQGFSVTQPGRLERICYDSLTYDEEKRPLKKEALVYLPFGYDGNPAKRYPVFYLMHGGGGDAYVMFGGLQATTELKDIIDQAIESGRIQPLIVVTPTYNIQGHDAALRNVQEACQLTHRFPKELQNDLIPYVDQHYRTRAERYARAFGGFSMGAEATWSALAGCAKDVAVYLPMSGDYWSCGVKASKNLPDETVDALLTQIKATGVSPGDYRIYAFTGTKDIAYEAMDAMLHAMEKRSPWFMPGENLFYYLKPEAQHTNEACLEYITLALPLLFPWTKG